MEEKIDIIEQEIPEIAWLDNVLGDRITGLRKGPGLEKFIKIINAFPSGTLWLITGARIEWKDDMIQIVGNTKQLGAYKVWLRLVRKSNEKKR